MIHPNIVTLNVYMCNYHDWSQLLNSRLTIFYIYLSKEIEKLTYTLMLCLLSYEISPYGAHLFKSLNTTLMIDH